MKWVLSILFVVGAVGALAQGTFQDLDFEQATLVNIGGYYNASDAFPGWQLSVGGNPAQVVLNGASAGGAEISIVNNYPIQGNYSVLLVSGGPLITGESASISQTATVPAGTESIQFDAANVFGPPFVVTLDGTPIDMISLQGFVNYELWGGNIPAAMAGQSETLTITQPAAAPEQGFVELDDIVFSPSPVTVTPEPDALTLMSIGGLVFGIYRRIQPRRG